MVPCSSLSSRKSHIPTSWVPACHHPSVRTSPGPARQSQSPFRHTYLICMFVWYLQGVRIPHPWWSPGCWAQCIFPQSPTSQVRLVKVPCADLFLKTMLKRACIRRLNEISAFSTLVSLRYLECVLPHQLDVHGLAVHNLQTVCQPKRSAMGGCLPCSLRACCWRGRGTCWSGTACGQASSSVTALVGHRVIVPLLWYPY